MSSSKSSSATSSTNRDGRVAGDNGAIGVSAEGSVALNVVADEAWELGRDALDAVTLANQKAIDAATHNSNEVVDAMRHTFTEALSVAQQSADKSASVVADTLSDALYSTQQASKSEAGQIGEQLVKVAIPAAVIGFIALATLRK